MMMQASPQFPTSPTKADSAKSAAQLIGEPKPKAEGREFERLFNDATQRESAKAEEELVGPVMQWNQSVDIPPAETLEKPKVDVKSRRDDATPTREEPVVRESRAAREDGKQTQAKPESGENKELKSGKAETPKGDVKETTKNETPKGEVKETAKDAQVAPKTQTARSEVAKMDASSEESVDAELMELMEPVEGEGETIELTETNPEMELEPELEDVTEDIDLSAEETIEAEETNTEQKSRLNVAEDKKTRSAEMQRVLEGKTDPKAERGEKAPPNGTNSAPRNPNMFAEVKTNPAGEPKPGSALAMDLQQQNRQEDASGQGGGTGQDLARDAELPQPVLNTQGVAATGQSQGPAQVFAQPSVQVNAVLEAIWARVTQFRARGDSQWSVQIRPDDFTKMELTIKVGVAGLEIQTRMQQGDMGRLMSSWGDLQQALSERGVNLKDLESGEESRQAYSGDPQAGSRDRDSASTNPEEYNQEGGFDRENWQQEDAEQPAETPARAASTYDGWENWA